MKVPHKKRYQLTGLGGRVAVLFTKTYGRVLVPGLTAMDPSLPEGVSDRGQLATAWRHLVATLDQFMESGLLAA